MTTVVDADAGGAAPGPEGAAPEVGCSGREWITLVVPGPTETGEVGTGSLGLVLQLQSVTVAVTVTGAHAVRQC